ncbi:SRPBCC domain-containing protein [Mycobacterium sp. D16Q16]|uniref:SRPBCC domain-containing protein n=1 Tax=Mycobacterium sp. D16Q16 TaxID=1855659 RepID=UPI0009929406|nr:SRPBCC domain-containing protein [Mycobacterium sp. D16Q16]
MVRAIWEFEHPRTQVWDAITDPDQWPVSVRGFRPELGAKFVIGSMPAVGTGYAGTLECHVVELAAGEFISVDSFAPKNCGPGTHWRLTGELYERDCGTSAVTNIYGVDTQDPEQRILLHLVSRVIFWIYGQAGEDLDEMKRPTRSLPNAVR